MAEVQKKPVKIVETVLRDAHQSLLATRMTTDQMLPIVDKMDKVGYYAVECWGGAEGRSVGETQKTESWIQEHEAPDAVPWSEYPWIQSLCR